MKKTSEQQHRGSVVRSPLPFLSPRPRAWLGGGQTTRGEAVLRDTVGGTEAETLLFHVSLMMSVLLNPLLADLTEELKMLEHTE